MRTYYSLDHGDKKVYDEQFQEIGTFHYTNEVKDLTQITKDKFIAQLHGLDVDVNVNGWYIIEKDLPLDALKAVCNNLIQNMRKYE